MLSIKDKLVLLLACYQFTEKNAFCTKKPRVNPQFCVSL